jgi:hypothetical protein
MKSFDGHTVYLNEVLIFSSFESNLHDFLKGALYCDGTGYGKSNILPTRAHFLFFRDLKLFERRLLV